MNDEGLCRVPTIVILRVHAVEWRKAQRATGAMAAADIKADGEGIVHGPNLRE